MRLIYAMLLGFILDLIFGDPHGLIHPVQIIGWFIDKLKKGMQHMIYGCSYEEVREKEIERKAGVEKTAGFFLMLFIVAGTFAVVYGILYVANLIHPVLRFCLETFFIYQILATKSLKTESMKVYKKLKELYPDFDALERDYKNYYFITEMLSMFCFIQTKRQ